VPGPGEVVCAQEREIGKLAAATISKNEIRLTLFTDCGAPFGRWRAVPGGARQVLALRPAAVPIHDHGHVTR